MVISHYAKCFRYVSGAGGGEEVIVYLFSIKSSSDLSGRCYHLHFTNKKTVVLVSKITESVHSSARILH